MVKSVFSRAILEVSFPAMVSKLCRLVVATALVLVCLPRALEAAFTSALSGDTATMTGDGASDTLIITVAGGFYQHNRAGDPGFASSSDFDSTVAGVQQLADDGFININAGGGDDTITIGPDVNMEGLIDGGPGADTINYGGQSTPIWANLGTGITGMTATLGADQEAPATSSTATGTATVSNFNFDLLMFDITVNVSGITPAAVNGFHIHQAPAGVNGPIIIDLTSLGTLVASGDGFTFTATNVSVPAFSEAAFLGGATYVNVHTAAFPSGAIRGQLFSTGNTSEDHGWAIGAGLVSNFEHVTGGSGNDSIVGTSAFNTLNGGGGPDFLLGGPGNDLLNGDAGTDVIMWSNGDGTDVMDGGADADTVVVNGSTSAGDQLQVQANGTRIDFDRVTPGPFSLDIGTTETLIVNGAGGNDNLFVGNLAGVASLTAVNLHGLEDHDFFTVFASETAGISIHGGNGSDGIDYHAETRPVTGDITPPAGSIESPNVLPVDFTHIEIVHILNSNVTHDYDGDGASDLPIWRPSTGTWFVLGSDSGFTEMGVVQFGLPGDLPVAGDFDGDGATDLAVYRPSNSTWYMFITSSEEVVTLSFGLTGDYPVPGDYDGDRRTDIAVYRPATGMWHILTSSSGYVSQTATEWGLSGDIPVPGDYDGDEITDMAVYRPSTSTWYFLRSTNGAGIEIPWGMSGDVPVPGDYDGDGTTDIAVHRPATGVWFLLHSGSGFTTSQSVQWGLVGDVPVPSDYDGDAITDLAVYRPVNGTWYIATSTSNYTFSASFQWGLNGDIPLPNSAVAYALALRSTLTTQVRASDFDADRQSDLTVFRPSNGTWYTRRSSSDFASMTTQQWGLPGDIPVSHDFDGNGQTDFAVFRPSNGTWFVTNGTTSATYQWGLNGDVPVQGDYDGDGISDPAVYRPSNGTWYLLHSSTVYSTHGEFALGVSGDVPVAGDYDGDGMTDLAVYRPSTGEWLIRHSSTDFATSESHQWGLPGDIAVPADYDGDMKIDPAVYRLSTGEWYILQSSTNYTSLVQQQWGLNGDIPVPGDFDGDRKADMAVWRPDNGTWYFLESSTNNTVFDALQWGLPGDIPVLKRP